MDLIAKVCGAPDQVQAADIQAVRDAGASDEAIRDALHVCALFTVLTRLADALAWRIPARSAFDGTAKFLLRNGYRFPAPLRWVARVTGLRA